MPTMMHKREQERNKLLPHHTNKVVKRIALNRIITRKVFSLFGWIMCFSSLIVNSAVFMLLPSSIAFRSVLWCIQQRKLSKTRHRNTANQATNIDWKIRRRRRKNEHYILTEFSNCLAKINEIEPIKVE